MLRRFLQDRDLSSKGRSQGASTVIKETTFLVQGGFAQVCSCRKWTRMHWWTIFRKTVEWQAYLVTLTPKPPGVFGLFEASAFHFWQYQPRIDSTKLDKD